MKLNRLLLLAASSFPELLESKDFNLPPDYTFTRHSWGQLFYKIYNTELNYDDAKAQCESDGSILAIPRSVAENKFLFGLVPDDLSIWIGIKYIGHKSLFLAADGRKISWTHWGPGEPNGGLNEKAVELRSYAMRYAYWNDVTVKKRQKFICAINIAGKIFISESIWITMGGPRDCK